MQDSTRFDTIVVGSGTSGAALARELSAGGQKVLLLERGPDLRPKEGLLALARMTDEVRLGEGMTVSRGLATGGSSNLYFGVAKSPSLEIFRRYGVELDTELEEVRAELGFAPLPEPLISEKSRRLRDSARALGHVWGAHDMLIDPKRCASGYSFDAIWRARSHIDQACAQGAELRNHARVERLLLEGDRAIGVEYTHSPALRWPRRLQAHADNIVIAAGELASPQLLRANGVTDIGQRGFFCNPGYVLYGVVPDASSADSFVGCMGGVEQEGVELGDANVPRFLHRLMMLGSFKPRHLMAYGGTLGIGVKVRDQVSGELDPQGRLRKHLSDEDRARLQRGEHAAREILEHAGARHVFNFGLVSAGRVGGMVRINEHVDADLQTRFRGLFVCDGSVIPDECRNPPAVTLLCLAKRLARRLNGSTHGAKQHPHH